jgi:hypothetical protein
MRLVLELTSFIKHDSHEFEYLTYHKESIDFNALCEEQFVTSLSCSMMLGKTSIVKTNNQTRCLRQRRRRLARNWPLRVLRSM